jgi:hypothetical protein
MKGKSCRDFRTATCLVLDSGSILIARGTHEYLDGGNKLQITIFDGSENEVVKSGIIQIIFIQKDGPTLLGQVAGSRGNIIMVDSLRTLDDQVRRNLRIPVEFDSFAYPISPDSGSRFPVRSNDLSCGGISFFTDREFSRGDQLEIVVPITAVNPLIVKCQILRQCAQKENIRLYAAKFIDMINDVETRIRETVFSVQLDSKS